MPFTIKTDFHVKTVAMAAIILTIFFWSYQTITAPAKALSDQPGRALYAKNCSSCHGINLQGGNAQSLIDPVWKFGNSHSQKFNNIKNGIPHLGMPSYKKNLTDQQINQILSFLKEAESAQKSATPKPSMTLQTNDYTINVQTFAQGLDTPWSMVFINSNHALVTERPGQLRQVLNGTLQSQSVKNTPNVLNEGQGGLLDIAIDPDYLHNKWIYLAYSHALPTSPGSREEAPAMTRLLRGRIQNNTWIDQQVIYQAPQESYLTTRHHYGCRITFDPKGYLYFSIGDRGHMDHAQNLTRPNGKIHRIHPDGSIPDDNPFIDQKNALPSIYTYGNRNPQGLATHPVTGDIWQTEHGPMGGDELNLIKPGVNYGWPTITYGINYNGTIITELRQKHGMQQPVLYWTPSIAVCGIDFYQGNLFPRWKNHLLVTALKYEEVRVLDIKDNRVLHQEIILKDAGRVRDIACGPDGAIYVVLNKPGTILRLTPVNK
ncbi:MAG: PQQ-dependent sugar dehydrogenase [Phycisphaerae bacterium]|nr:PQQ-dependent sugar dehydrogenase [Phycisphaerae bacterium]